METKKRDKSFFIFLGIFILGMSLMLYPFISDMLNTVTYDSKISDYNKTIENELKKVKEDKLNLARQYNASLSSIQVTDMFTINYEENNEDAVYNNLLNMNEEGMMGYIDIPSIYVKIPIYHGTDAQVLEKGVGHLKGSSLPVGGENTNSILAAHSGLPSARLFTDLDDLIEGDIFYIKVLDETLAYKVDNIQVIEPTDTDALIPSKSGDYVTLVTCTPYGVNTQRLIVRGIRTELTETTENVNDSNSMLIRTVTLEACIVGAFILIGFIVVKKVS